MNALGGIPFFKKGDIGGLTYVVTNNIINYLVVISTLSGVFQWPAEIVFGKVIPGMSIGLMISCFVYCYMAVQLAKREGRTNVTALPSGVSTPAMFVMLYGVIMPLNFTLEDPNLVWQASVAACFVGGFVEFCGGIIGPWMKRKIPRAALLGTVAGIGFIWMSTQGLFDIYSDPVVGLPILIIAMLGVFGGYLFPKGTPPLVVAVVGGIIYAYALGRTSFDFSNVGIYVPNPATSLEHLLDGFVLIVPYLTIIIPIEIYNFIETMDNVEAANAAGDNYDVRKTQFADGACTMISAIFGGVVPNTVWLGHAGLRQADAGIGYSAVSGIIFGIAGFFGLFTFFSGLVPPAITGITYLWCATIMVSQAFRVCDRKHFAAIGIAMVPPVADFLFTQVTGMAGLSEIWPEQTANGVMGFDPVVSQQILDAGVLWNGVPEVKAGAIIIGLILGALTVFIIDHQLDKAAWTMLAGAGLAGFGFIHSAALGVYPTSPFVFAYLVAAILFALLHISHKRSTLIETQEDFDYV